MYGEKGKLVKAPGFCEKGIRKREESYRKFTLKYTFLKETPWQWF